MRDAIASESKRIEEDTLFSSRSHFRAAAGWSRVYWLIGIPNAVLAGISGISVLADRAFLAGVLAVIVAASTAVVTFLNPSERSSMHLRAGNRFNALRNRARVFHQIDCISEASDSDLRIQLKRLEEDRDTVNLDSPQPPNWAYKAAKEGIERGEASYTVDAET